MARSPWESMKVNSRRSSSISSAPAVHSRVIAASSSSAPARPSSPCKTKRYRSSLCSSRMLNIASRPAQPPSWPGHYRRRGAPRCLSARGSCPLAERQLVEYAVSLKDRARASAGSQEPDAAVALAKELFAGQERPYAGEVDERDIE